MSLAQGKKRYSLTLSRENFEQLQGLLQEFGQPATSALISNLVDEFLHDVTERMMVLKLRKNLGENPRLVDLLEQLHKTLVRVKDEQMNL